MLSRLHPVRWLTSSVVILCGLFILGSWHAKGSVSENNPFCRHRVKIVSQTFAVRFRINASSYQPGKSAVFRVDNIGRVPIGLIGEVFSLERFTDGKWRISPQSPRAFSRIRLGVLGSGKSGFCRSFTIPSDIEPGHYRFRKVVTVGLHRKRRRLFVRFHVRTNPDLS